MRRTYTVTEHHILIKTGHEWTVDIGTATNRTSEVARLAVLRQNNQMPATLSHWTVGDEKVAGQFAFEMFNRQFADDFCDYCADGTGLLEGSGVCPMCERPTIKLT